MTTFYLKYRPQTVEELDLDKVRVTLEKIVKSGKIPHAFLFSGPKGTGKTSAARILAKIVNCASPNKSGEPCNKCDQCLSISKGGNLDVIELDAASHRGIDDIRALREAVKLAPAKAKKKVYIIDEAHMLTTEASNALLKTLEEPPDHILFVLATTNPEKLTETIRSRTTNIAFYKASVKETIRSLKKVVKGENLNVGEDVLEIIAKFSDGSFRDAVKILEQLVLEGRKLVREEVQEFLSDQSKFDVDEFLESLAKYDLNKVLTLIEKSIEKGASPKNIALTTIEKLRESLLSKIGLEEEVSDLFSNDELIQLIKLVSEAASKIPYSLIEQMPLEIAVIEWCEGKKKSKVYVADQTTGERNEPGQENKNKVNNEIIKENEKLQEGENSIKIKSGRREKNGFSDEVWTKILAGIKPKNTSTEALLRAAKPIDFDGDNLTLGVYYRFHKERLEANPHRVILEETIESVWGNKVKVICTLTEPPAKEEKPESSDKSNLSEDKEGVVLTEGNDENIIKIAKEVFGS